MSRARIEMPREQIADFCRRHHIRRLSLFGSVLRDDFTPESDVDVLVEFEVGRRIDFLMLAEAEIELSRLLNRRVDLRTAPELSPYFRDEVVAEAEEQYVQT
jgi:predicted nucleotidyltransferase